MKRFGKYTKHNSDTFVQAIKAEYENIDNTYDFLLYEKLKQCNIESSSVKSKSVKENKTKMTRLSELEASNLYNTLNLPDNCSMEDIRKSYKKLCILAHPDKGGNVDDFRKINEAYKILSSPLTRQIFDTFGSKSIGIINEILKNNQLNNANSDMVNQTLQQGDLEALACMFQVSNNIY